MNFASSLNSKKIQIYDLKVLSNGCHICTTHTVKTVKLFKKVFSISIVTQRENK